MTKESGGFDQIDQWKSTMFLYSSALKSINTKIEILNNEFIQLYNYNPIEHITSRLKTPESIVKKLKNDGCEVTIENMVEHLNDIAGIRIICSFMSDIYPIADMIARQADITVLHVKDYIKYPKTNGYKSYHMVVTIPVYLSEGKRDTKVEIQIRRSACTPFSVPADTPINFIFSLLEFPVLTRAETAYVGPFPASSSCLFSAFSRSRRFSSSTRRSSSSTAMIAWFKENIFMSSISTISAQDFNSRSR